MIEAVKEKVRSTRTAASDRLEDTFGEDFDVKGLEKFVWIMDDFIRIPLVGWRFGLEPVIALFFPFVGEIVVYVMSTIILFYIVREGVPVRLGLKMSWNVIRDFLVGSIPFVGHFYDFWDKANRRNYELLMEYKRDNKHSEDVDFRRTLKVVAITMATAGVVALGLFVWAAAFTVDFLWEMTTTGFSLLMGLF